MPEQSLAGGERQALARRVLRVVGWLLEDVDAFEERPKRMRRIRQATRSKCVRLQEVSEFVVDDRLGNGPQRQQRGTCQENQQPRSDPARCASLRQPRHEFFAAPYKLVARSIHLTQSAKIVGRTPRSARVPLDLLLATESISSNRKAGQGPAEDHGVRPTIVLCRQMKFSSAFLSQPRIGYRSQKQTQRSSLLAIRPSQ